jgi:CheY-like chemotaxis protein
MNSDVFLIDDNPANLNALAALLRESGHRVRLATSGARGLEAVRASLPDLILLDITMPEMDGYAVCEALRADPATKDVPVIFISAHDEAFDKVKAFTSGGVDYVTKPFQAEEVLARVQHHLTISRLRREMVEKNAELERQTEVARHASQAKSRFLASITQELRAPLNAILGYSEMLVEQVTDLGQDELAPDLRKIHESATQQLKLIDGMLELSKIESGTIELVLDEFSVQDVAEASAAMARKVAAKNASLIEVHDTQSAGLMHGDATRVRQVLFNLLSHACRSKRQGKVTLDVSRETEAGREWVAFRISDEGSAVTEDHLAQAVSERLCRVMGGDLKATSGADGKGAAFTVRLPARIERGRGEESWG